MGLSALVACKGVTLNPNLGGPRGLYQSWTPERNQLVGYWSLDKVTTTNNSAVDAEIGSSGTVSNGNGSGVTVIAGVSNQGLAFDGITGHVRVHYAPQQNPQHFSVSLWVYPADVSGTLRTMLASQSGSPAQGFAVSLNGANQIQATIGHGDNSWGTVMGPVIVNEQWSHIVVTYDGTYLQIYHDGALGGSVVTAFVPNVSGWPIYIGAGHTELDPSAANYYSGGIDEVGIWSVALRADEVSTIYQHQSP